MARYREQHDDGPHGVGIGFAGLLVVAMITTGALMVKGMTTDRPAEMVYLQNPAYVEEIKEPAISSEESVEELTVAIDDTIVSSTTPACNIASCTDAYRSFDPSDCTFQPYEGPRRLCTRR